VIRDAAFTSVAASHVEVERALLADLSSPR